MSDQHEECSTKSARTQDPNGAAFQEHLFSPETEARLLACALIDPDGFLQDVPPAHFHDPDNELIWKTGQELVRQGVYVDVEVIQDALASQGASIPFTRLAQLVAMDVFSGNAPIFAAKVNDLAGRRAALELLERSYGDAANAIYTSNGSYPDDVASALVPLVTLFPRETAPAVPKADLSECPPLPADAQLEPQLAVGASPWLDEYQEFSRKWAPRAYEGFHEAVGLWILSTIAARRVQVDLGGQRFTNLYLANVARSSVWTKSTAHKIGSETIDQAGLRYLLAPDDATPAALLQRMARQTVTNWDNLTLDDQEATRKRIAFAGQRGWDFDEFGHKVAAIMRDSGPMADFRGILRKLDDCPKSYEYLTIAHGSAMLERPYLSILGSMTPADMRPYAKRGGPLWGDGFWARFAFVAPGPDEEPIMGRFPAEARAIPYTLTNPLRNWHNLLGQPSVEVVEHKADDDAKASARKWDVHIGDPPVQVCILGAGVFEAFYNYHDALTAIARANDNTDLDGNYSRFAEKALRVAALLASLGNEGRIELCHWARAQAIAERWRQSLHNLYLTLNSAQDEEAKTEERVISIVRRLGTATPIQVKRYLPDLSTANIATIMDRLTRAGAIQVLEMTRKGTPRYGI